MLAREGKSFRKGTSARIIPPAENIAIERDQFYASILNAFPDGHLDEQLVLNFDQTFQLFNPNRGFTWEKRGAARVQLTISKDGFTFCPVVSLVSVVGAQLIFAGSTSGVFPTVSPGSFLKYLCTHNHWSNEQTTLALWKEIIAPHIAARRCSSGLGE